jgi:hypothetical protein
LDFKKQYIILILLFIFVSSSNSEEKNFSEFLNAFGMKASNISGYGFYYNRRINKEFQIQSMGLIYYYVNKDEQNEYKNFNYDIGLELQRNMFKSQSNRWYLMAGAYYYYDDESDKSSENSKTIVNNSFNIGVGLGYEYHYKRFLFSLELGYKFFEDHKVITETGLPAYPVLDRLTKIGLGCGIGFTF